MSTVPTLLRGSSVRVSRHDRSQESSSQDVYNSSTTTKMAAAISAATPSSSQTLNELTVKELLKQGFPRGLIEELWNGRNMAPVRFWVVDNSGSMLCPDGHLYRFDDRKDTMQVAPSTRWAELQATVEYHAQMAGTLQLYTTFRMLNPGSSQKVKSEFSISSEGSTVQQDIANAKAIIRMSQADGVTPLTQHVHEIYQKIQQIQDALIQHGQKAVVVLATDGLPSDAKGNSTKEIKEEFIESLQQLQALPVWLVVRLCTDDPGCAKFYNSLDLNLELPLEVLDDLKAEAEQVSSYNDWLNYSLPIHRCREMGFRHRVLDLLDERKLTKDECLEFAQLLFGRTEFQKDDVHSNFRAFLKHVSNVVKKEKKQWNPLTRKMEPWVDVKKLEKAFRPRKRASLFARR